MKAPKAVDHRGAAARGGDDGASHRVGDVVELQVQEDGAWRATSPTKDGPSPTKASSPIFNHPTRGPSRSAIETIRERSEESSAMQTRSADEMGLPTLTGLLPSSSGARPGSDVPGECARPTREATETLRDEQ